MSDQPSTNTRRIAAGLLAGLAIVLAVGLLWLSGLFGPAVEAPGSPSPTAAAPASPSPSPVTPGPTESPALSPSPQPTQSPQSTDSPQPSPSPTRSPSPPATPPTGWVEVTDFPTYRGSTNVNSIAVGGPGFVAVGDGGRQLRGRVWTSPDGLRWTAQPDNHFAGSSLRKVVPVGSNLFLFGTGLEGPQVWRSTDARNWQLLPHSPEFLYAGINDVAVVGQSMLAVGFIDDPDGEFSGAAWRSDDGVTWQRVSAPGGDEDAWAVAAQGSTVVALYRFAPLHGGAAIYYSTDMGDSWRVAQTDFPTGEDASTGLVSLAATEQRFVAVGYADTFDYPPIAARSADGSSWTSGTPPGGELLSQVVALSDGRFLAFGRTPLVSSDGSSWTERPGYTDQRPPQPPEGGDEVAVQREVAAGQTGVVVIQQWTESVRVWFGPLSLFE